MLLFNKRDNGEEVGEEDISNQIEAHLGKNWYRYSYRIVMRGDKSLKIPVDASPEDLLLQAPGNSIIKEFRHKSKIDAKKMTDDDWVEVVKFDDISTFNLINDTHWTDDPWDHVKVPKLLPILEKRHGKSMNDEMVSTVWTNCLVCKFLFSKPTAKRKDIEGIEKGTKRIKVMPDYETVVLALIDSIDLIGMENLHDDDPDFSQFSLMKRRITLLSKSYRMDRLMHWKETCFVAFEN